MRVTALREGLLKLGWTEGQNVRFEYRYWSASDLEAIQKLAGEIVNTRPDVIVTDTTPVTEAVLHETRTIPSSSCRSPTQRQRVRREVFRTRGIMPLGLTSLDPDGDTN